MSAWNYPLVTGIDYVATNIAAGNCVLFKPSERAPHVSNVCKELFDKYLDKRFYQVLEGGVETSTALTTSNLIDVIVFTGGTFVGKIIAKNAAENLVPCILELGGKCPTIIDEGVDIENTCKKIALGKFMNAG